MSDKRTDERLQKLKLTLLDYPQGIKLADLSELLGISIKNLNRDLDSINATRVEFGHWTWSPSPDEMELSRKIVGAVNRDTQ